MIYAVFLCDKNWKIRKIRQCNKELPLMEEEFLTDVVSEKEELLNMEEDYCSLDLTFVRTKLTTPAIIRSFKEGNLVILVFIRSNQDFMDFNNVYPEYVEWAKDCMFGLYHDEYYLIQQLNNQLIDAQRSLVQNNVRLEQALKKNEEINEKLEAARLSAEKAMQRAEKANRSKTKFLANMSHDIRTPMNAIVGIAGLMEYHLDNPEVLKGYISKLQSSSQYLLDLINDILDLSKIENGSMELRIEPMDLREQIEQIITIIKPQINGKNQRLIVQNEDLEQRYVLGDPVRFRQVLMNIFSNAMKYTPEEGTIRFTVLEEAARENMDAYQFIIEDSGMGMTKGFVEHIFEPFARAEGSVRGIQGTGLGMAITKSIVDAMGGEISVYSEPGRGSQFKVSFSFQQCETSELADGTTAEKMLPDEKKNSQSVSLKGLRFLCAEDNELNAEILTSMLELAGAGSVVYGDGKQVVDAFSVAAPGEYDGILMDVQMPVMNGYEATRAIRSLSREDAATIPIIAMTANAFQEDIQRSLDAGMNAHITKPLNMEELFGIIGKTVKKINSEKIV